MGQVINVIVLGHL